MGKYKNQEFGNIGSGQHQASGDERKKIRKAVLGRTRKHLETKLWCSVVTPKHTCIINSSSTILLWEITLSGSSIVILHLSSCQVALRLALFIAARIRPSVSRQLEIFFSLRGLSPQALSTSGGGLFPAPEAAMISEMPTGLYAFLEM